MTVTRQEKMAHTPGPWTVMAPLPKSYSDHGYRTVCEVRRDGQTLHVYAYAHKMWRDDSGYTWGSDDAYLIAAAPELLASLKELGDWIAAGLNAPDGALPDSECLRRTEEIAERARAAIAKAEGRS